MALLQNFHGFAPWNMGMNKNGELAENKINLCLKQNKIKKRYQAESKINLYLNQNKIKKIPGKYERHNLIHLRY